MYLWFRWFIRCIPAFHITIVLFLLKVKYCMGKCNLCSKKARRSWREFVYEHKHHLLDKTESSLWLPNDCSSQRKPQHMHKRFSLSLSGNCQTKHKELWEIFSQASAWFPKQFKIVTASSVSRAVVLNLLDSRHPSSTLCQKTVLFLYRAYHLEEGLGSGGRGTAKQGCPMAPWLRTADLGHRFTGCIYMCK